MSKATTSQRVQQIIVAIILCFLVGMFLLFLAIPFLYFTGIAQVLWRLVTGWIFFLNDHLPRMSTNAATWVPGVLALIIAAAVGHGFLRAWAKRREKRWSLGSTLALAMIVPVLFVISFLVPGIILQGTQLAGVKWVHHSPSRPGWTQGSMVSDFWLELVSTATKQDEPPWPFPNSLAELETVKRGAWIRMATDFRDPAPPELPIYLGAGFSADSDPGLPLLISARFASEQGFSRYVKTIGGKQIMIRDAETDQWIQRSLDARAGVEKAR
ncbi:hypothetical protein [Luteolibacter luteus]|uniref:Uncharacterized protein n=1 Tax=Luteolibacter luteus TaxID=2728835 RepID=A0A858RJ18_9BACT|nr:hypothetical protein [Luteolibacter luteus]QJE96715.1 hypothetical protein HHL09_13295 [Luteolibacter luteus]